MPEEALQAAFEIKTACDEISRRLLRWHWEHKPGAHSLGALLDHVAQRHYEQRHQQPQHPRNRFPSDRKGSRATCNDKENRKDHLPRQNPFQ